MRINLLVLDGFPIDKINEAITPNLWSLGKKGGRASNGGLCELPSSTYPSHATILTGRLPQYHEVWSGLASNPRPGVVPGWAGLKNIKIPTILDRCVENNTRCAAIVSDYKLYPILRSDVAHHSWPVNGIIPPGTPRDPFGYPTNDSVRSNLLAAVQDKSFSFVFGHLNETDTIGHINGPDHKSSIDSYKFADKIVGEVVDVLAEDWENTILIVLADHGMEALTRSEPINLTMDERLRDYQLEIVEEGGCALVHRNHEFDQDKLVSILMDNPGVVSCFAASAELLVLGAQPGLIFGTTLRQAGIGIHGGIGTAAVVTIVGGGNSFVPVLASAIQQYPPHLADWAPTVASLLGISFPENDGKNLVGLM